jgi:hypothetical protein
VKKSQAAGVQREVGVVAEEELVKSQLQGLGVEGVEGVGEEVGT